MATNVTSLNIVLVHGAWADGSSWGGVIPILTGAGHKVIAVNLSYHSVADDIAIVKRAIDFIGGPIILVGHSYGGETINAVNRNQITVQNLFVPLTYSIYSQYTMLTVFYIVFINCSPVHILPALQAYLKYLLTILCNIVKFRTGC